MTNRHFNSTVATLACAVLLLPASAQASERRLLVVNASDEPIFAVRIGNAAQNAWGRDLLPFNDVIDVSRGRELKVTYDETQCTQDIAATYRDGLVVVLRSVDLCNATQLSFRR